MNEKENTFRRLCSKPLLISSVGCYLGLHSWTHWSEPVKKNRQGYEYIFDTIQERTCRHCNRYDKRLI